MDIFFVIICLATLYAGIHLLWVGIRTKSLSSRVRAIYILLALPMLYDFAIYGLMIANVIPVTGYGAYIRPAVPVIVLSPVIFDYMFRVRKGKV